MFACLIVQLLPSPLRMHVFPTNLLEIECSQNRMRNTLQGDHSGLGPGLGWISFESSWTPAAQEG